MTAVPQQNLVVLDTDVWSNLYSRRRALHPSVPAWRDLLLGRTALIATQTRAEVLTGVLQRDLGEARSSEIREQLNQTPTVPVDESVVTAFAELVAQARQSGHPIHQKHHTGDAWIAATAIALGVPLLAGDAIYLGAPGLSMLEGPAQEAQRE